MKNIFIQSVSAALVVLIDRQLSERWTGHVLGDLSAKIANPPGGPLKFYAAFDGTTSNPLDECRR